MPVRLFIIIIFTVHYSFSFHSRTFTTSPFHHFPLFVSKPPRGLYDTISDVSSSLAHWFCFTDIFFVIYIYIYIYIYKFLISRGRLLFGARKMFAHCIDSALDSVSFVSLRSSRSQCGGFTQWCCLLFVRLSPVKFVKSSDTWQHLTGSGSLSYRLRHTC